MIVSDFRSSISNKSLNNKLHAKNFSGGPYGLSFYDYLYNSGNLFDLAIIQSINLYASVSPFFLAVDKIARSISEIEFKVLDTKSGEFIEHEVLELLAKPNADVSGCEFKYEISTFFSITGNSFLVSTGRETKPPLEIWSIQPQRVIPQFGKMDSLGQFPARYQITSILNSAIFFNATEVQEDQFSTIRYYNEINGELWHIRQLNPFYSANNFYGMTKAKPIMLELEQYVSGNINNLSLLKRGARPSVAWVNNRGEELTESQWERLQDEAKKYSGDANAGGTPILDGMDIKEMSQNNRDMQFKELQEATRATIFSVYGIPLALMSDSVMTFNNLETSQTQFYDNAVIPQLNYITTELTRFLMYRYENSENLAITYSTNDIEALKARTLDNASKISLLNVNTINEIRTFIGDKPLDEGGDVIMASSSSTPIAGEDMPEPEEQPSSNNDANSNSVDDDNETNSDSKAEFFKRMRKIVNNDGTKRYTDDKINQLWNNVKCL